MPNTLVKHAIKFEDGQYMRDDTQSTADLKDAWTFNKADRAKAHAKQLGLKGFKIVSVEVTVIEDGASTYLEKV